MALVLHRKEGQRVLIDDGAGNVLEVEVHRISKTAVSLLFLGGEKFHIDRKEYREKKIKEHADLAGDVNGKV